jgi:hypothetical protein
MRQLLFVVASLGLAVLLVVLMSSPAESGAFLPAALTNLAVVGWSSFVLPLRGLPRFDEYFELRAWERSGQLYDVLGVPLFRSLVRRGPLSLFNHALPAAWHSGDPERIEHEARTAEVGHAVAFLFVLALALTALGRGEPRQAAWLAVLDVPTNLYPVLLQRYHRVRLAKLVLSGEMASPGAAKLPEGAPARSNRTR